MVWQLLFDIAAAVPIGRWQLVGGQMVLLHGLCAGRQPLRATHDIDVLADLLTCLLYTSPSPRDRQKSRMPSSA